MPAPIYHLGATAICSHAGQVTPIPTQARVTVSGQPVICVGDTGVIAGCPFTIPGPKPQPCVTAKWLMGAIRVTVQGRPVIIQINIGQGISAEQAPQAAISILATQPRASAT